MQSTTVLKRSKNNRYDVIRNIIAAIEIVSEEVFNKYAEIHIYNRYDPFTLVFNTAIREDLIISVRQAIIDLLKGTKASTIKNTFNRGPVIYRFGDLTYTVCIEEKTYKAQQLIDRILVDVEAPIAALQLQSSIITLINIVVNKLNSLQADILAVERNKPLIINHLIKMINNDKHISELLNSLTTPILILTKENGGIFTITNADYEFRVVYQPNDALLIDIAVLSDSK